MLLGHRDVRVIAHRGASASRLENTIAAYDRALADGAAVLEVDVRALADGTPVAVHDATLARTSGDPRRVSDLTAEDLEELPPVTRPPLLGAVLGRYGSRTRYLIDLKEPAAPIESRVLETIASHGLARRTQLQSFDGVALRRIRRVAPGASIAQLYPAGARSGEIAAGLAAVARYAVAIGPESGSVDALLVAAARARGLAVQPYTVNAPAEAERLLSLCVDGIITDAPAMAREVVAAGRAERAVAA